MPKPATSSIRLIGWTLAVTVPLLVLTVVAFLGMRAQKTAARLELQEKAETVASSQAEVLSQQLKAAIKDLPRVSATPLPGQASSFDKILDGTSIGELTKLRDNPECATQELETLAAGNPGFSSTLSFDASEDVAAPFLNLQRPKIVVLREQGVNGQIEMAAAFERAGFAPVDVHMSDLINGDVQLADFPAVVACGGFSYGDVLGGGGGWAKSVLFNERLRQDFADFFAADRLALGVCNGCQMLSVLRDVIPGTEDWPYFRRNRSEQFEARLSLVEVQESPSVLLAGMAGSRLPVAVAHGEGRAVFTDEAANAALESRGGVGLRFIENTGDIAELYPANPNGSPSGITSVCNEDGRVTIMMPHPERVIRTRQLSWAPKDWGDDSPWLRLFRNARVFLS